MAGLGQYSWLDRLTHRVAFAGHLQLAVSDIEDKLFGGDLADLETDPPIFITALPRAGTTILLLALAAQPGLASALYRDMPFVMAPLIWDRLSGRFRKAAKSEDRAHGDGIKIGYDSPEAFEEALWIAHGPDHYQTDKIALWSARELDAELQRFFEQYFRKIVRLRLGPGARGRYISKNNGNIARLSLLRAMCPEARILVPIRSPLSHAASLLNQHRNFLTRHGEDRFVRRYMADIGHFEFGELHRPIQFEGFADLALGLSPDGLDYWLAYWIAATEHVQAQGAAVDMVNYEALAAGSESSGRLLCDLLGLDPDLAGPIGCHFRPVLPPDPEVAAHHSPLRERAEALYAQLSTQAP